jgi:hypothetical protein
MYQNRFYYFLWNRQKVKPVFTSKNIIGFILNRKLAKITKSQIITYEKTSMVAKREPDEFFRRFICDRWLFSSEMDGIQLSKSIPIRSGW